MGSKSKIDRHAKERYLETLFPLGSTKGVLALLNRIHHIRERRYRGDFDACILLLDLERSLEKIKLTERQKQILYLVFEKGYTQAEAGEALGITQQAVNDHILTVARKVAAYNRRMEKRERLRQARLYG